MPVRGPSFWVKSGVNRGETQGRRSAGPARPGRRSGPAAPWRARCSGPWRPSRSRALAGRRRPDRRPRGRGGSRQSCGSHESHPRQAGIGAGDTPRPVDVLLRHPGPALRQEDPVGRVVVGSVSEAPHQHLDGERRQRQGTDARPRLRSRLAQEALPDLRDDRPGDGDGRRPRGQVHVGVPQGQDLRGARSPARGHQRSRGRHGCRRSAWPGGRSAPGGRPEGPLPPGARRSSRHWSPSLRRPVMPGTTRGAIGAHV